MTYKTYRNWEKFNKVDGKLNEKVKRMRLIKMSKGNKKFGDLHSSGFVENFIMYMHHEVTA